VYFSGPEVFRGKCVRLTVDGPYLRIDHNLLDMTKHRDDDADLGHDLT